MARILMPLADDFEDVEYEKPYERLRAAGHKIWRVGSVAGATVTGKRGQVSANVDQAAKDLKAEEFDALVIPGGYSPDHLRTDPDVVNLVRQFAELDRPVAAICHGPQLLIEADVALGRTMTSWPSVRTDLENAGAYWVDVELCEDGAFITSRKPADLDAFVAAILRHLGESSQGRGTHSSATA